MYATYNSLKQIAITDNRKFLLPSVVFPESNEHQVCSNKQTCNAWKNDPTYWGPHLWYYLHYSTMNYPKFPTKQQAREMEEWLCKLPVTIPCKTCKHHYNEYIQTHRNELQRACQNGDALFNFLVDVHNQVNIRNNKPVLSYEEARKLYI